MTLHLHNTLTRTLEPFEPLEEGKVGVYGCGPTIYGPAHIGNFRSFLFYDLVHRTLEWKGYQVRFVMNLTDVDDKTIRGAREHGLRLGDFTAPHGEAVLAESDALGIRRNDAYPRATEYLDEMRELVQRLLDRGLAYTTDDGSVFFRITAFPEYGKLSRKDLSQVRQGERVAADEYGKDDVRDFALWKGAKPEDEEVGAAWDAPWGRGRPGWHLECSAMGMAELGETFDLHLGGEDLIFPHHEDEIAQSEGATGKPFARYWLHVKHLRVEGEKMSKSLGNFITVRELLDEGVDPAAIRHQLLSAHYRSELNFTRAGLEASSRAVARLLDFDARLRDHPVSDPEDGSPEEGEGAGAGSGTGTHPTTSEHGPSTGHPLADAARRALTRFGEAMDDDLNVAEALGAVFVFLKEANAVLDRSGAVPGSVRDEAVRALESMDEVLGLLEVGRRGRTVDHGFATWVEERIEARARARSERNWAAADAVRDELTAAGVVLEDGAEGTRWKRVGGGAPESR